MTTKPLLILFSVFLWMANSLLASEPISPAQFAAQNTQRLLTSLRDGDRAVFIENSTDKFQTAMTEKLFTEARTALAPILNQPAQLDFLGTLNKSGSVVYLYRLRPEKGGDDSLVTTEIKDGKISGFFMN